MYKKLLSTLPILFYINMVCAQTDTTGLLALAQQSVKAQLWDDAIGHTTKILDIDPKNWEVLVLRAYAYLYKDEKEKCMGDIREASDYTPFGPAKTFWGFGALCLQSGFFEESIQFIDESIMLDSTDHEPMMGKGMAYMELNNPEQAVVWLEKAIQTNQLANQYESTLAEAYHKLGNDDAANNHFKNHLANYPEDIESATTYLEFLIDQGKQLDAFVVADNIIKKGAEDGSIYYIRGDLGMKLNKGEPCSDLRKATELGAFTQFSDLDYYCAPLDKTIPIKAGSKLRFQITQGDDYKNFDVALKIFSTSEISFDWSIGEGLMNGQTKMTSNALKKGASLLNYFKPNEHYQLTDKTCVWVSQEVFNVAKSKKSIRIDTGKGVFLFDFKKSPKDATCLYLLKGEKRKAPILVGMNEEKGYIINILNDPKNPLIVSMILDFDVVLELVDN